MMVVTLEYNYSSLEDARVALLVTEGVLLLLTLVAIRVARRSPHIHI